MKLNNKGFMMAEVVVVSTIICTVLVTLYISITRITNLYELRNKYHDINALYFTNDINTSFIANGYINGLTLANTTVEINLLSSSFNLDNIVKFYDMDSIRMYYSPYTKDHVLEVKDIASTKTLSEYIDYLDSTYTYNEKDYYGNKYSYVLITEMCKTKDECSYYGLRVR